MTENSAGHVEHSAASSTSPLFAKAEPSAYFTTVATCCDFAGAFSTRAPGAITRETAAGAAGSSFAPPAIQSWMYS